MHWLIGLGLIIAASACGHNAAPVQLDTGATPTSVPWTIEPTPTARPPTAVPMPTPTGVHYAPTVAPPPVHATSTPVPALPRSTPAAAARPPVAVLTVRPASPAAQPPSTPAPVRCNFTNGIVEIRPYSTPQPPTGLTAYAAGEPLSGLHLELRLSRTTFVAGALIQSQVVVRNTNSVNTSVDVGVSALPQTVPADPRSFPIVFPGPGFGRPPVTVAPGQSQTISSFRSAPVRCGPACARACLSSARHGHHRCGCPRQTNARWTCPAVAHRRDGRSATVVRAGHRCQRPHAHGNAAHVDDRSQRKRIHARSHQQRYR